jgi:hypothetical protein
LSKGERKEEKMEKLLAIETAFNIKTLGWMRSGLSKVEIVRNSILKLKCELCQTLPGPYGANDRKSEIHSV